MKLGKTLNLSKCFYDKDHWTHPDLKEGQLYIIHIKDSFIVGRFRLRDSLFYGADMIFEDGLSPHNFTIIFFRPLQEGWKHIQEVII